MCVEGSCLTAACVESKGLPQFEVETARSCSVPDRGALGCCLLPLALLSPLLTRKGPEPLPSLPGFQGRGKKQNTTRPVTPLGVLGGRCGGRDRASLKKKLPCGPKRNVHLPPNYFSLSLLSGASWRMQPSGKGNLAGFTAGTRRPSHHHDHSLPKQEGNMPWRGRNSRPGTELNPLVVRAQPQRERQQKHQPFRAEPEQTGAQRKGRLPRSRPGRHTLHDKFCRANKLCSNTPALIS